MSSFEFHHDFSDDYTDYCSEQEFDNEDGDELRALESGDFQTYNELITTHLSDWEMIELVEYLLPEGLVLSSDDQARRFIASPHSITSAIGSLSEDAAELLQWFSIIGPKIDLQADLTKPLVIDPSCWLRRAHRPEVYPLVEELKSKFLLIADINTPGYAYVPMEVARCACDDLVERRQTYEGGYLIPPLLVNSASHLNGGPADVEEIYSGLCHTVTIVGALMEGVKYGHDRTLGLPIPNVKLLADALALPHSSYEPFHPTQPYGALAELAARLWEAGDEPGLSPWEKDILGLSYDCGPMSSLETLMMHHAMNLDCSVRELDVQDIFRGVEFYYRELFRSPEVTRKFDEKLGPMQGVRGLKLSLYGTFFWKSEALWLGRLFTLTPSMEWELDRLKVAQWCAWDDPDYVEERLGQMSFVDDAIMELFTSYRYGPAFNPRYNTFNNSALEDPWKVCSVDAEYDDPETPEFAIMAALMRFQEFVAEQAPSFSHVEQEELWACMRDPHREIWIDYRDQEEQLTRRRIGRIYLDGQSIRGFCRLRNDQRQFSLDRISAIYAAEVPDFDFDDLT